MKKLLSLSACIILLSNVSAQTWQESDSLRNVYLEKQSFDTALIYAQQAAELVKEEFGEMDTLYADMLNGLVSVLGYSGKYFDAIVFADRELNIRQRKQGDDHEKYREICTWLGYLYTSTGQYDKAVQIFEETLVNYEKNVGKININYLSVVNNLTVLYTTIGQYDKALQLCLFNREIAYTVLGSDNQYYLKYLNTLAQLYARLNQYHNAFHIYLELREKAESLYGKKHLDFVIYTHNLGNAYQHIGQYEMALPLFLEAFEIVEILLGKEHINSSQILFSIAVLYSTMGQFDKALPIYFELKDNYTKYLGVEHREYGNLLGHIAITYKRLGQYDKALPLYLEAIEIIEKALGKKHSEYGSSLNNLASLYKSMNQYDKALPLYLEALENTEKALGKDHSYYGVSLNNLASLYKSMGQYDKALALSLEALENTEKALGKAHSSYGVILNNLAGMYESMGHYAEALPVYLEALENTENALGKQHSEYGISLNNLALLHQKIGQYNKALPIYREAIQNNIYNINQAFSFLAESEKEKFIKTLSENFNNYKSFFLDYAPENPAVAGDAYNIELATKGMILQAGIQMREAIEQSGDSAALAKYDQWQVLRQTIANQYSQPIENRLQNLPEMEAEAEALEGELARVSSAFSESQKLGTIKWQDIQHVLNPNEACVEFSSFAYKKAGEDTDSIMYVALVLLPDSEHPILVPLCEQKQLDSILVQSLSNKSSLNRMYRAAMLPDFNSVDYGKRLYELIWQPLRKYIPENNLVYFAPSGSLHKIAFAAIPVDDNTRLSDKYRLMQLSSTAVLLQQSKFNNTPESIALFGGINYEAVTEELLAKAKNLRSRQEFVSRSISSEADRGSSNWGYLPGTLQEVNAIENIAKKKKVTSTKFTGNAAIEEQFKSLKGNNSPRIIHISTHGFFFEDAEQGEHYNAAKNPLNRAGLLFAGANTTWQGKTTTDGIDDGILTAYEATNVTFGNTQLVVLSACETGLGEIKGSEGVFGLQRAFKNAGAEYIIMSLWKVPDAETAEFMEYFYKKLFGGESIPDAFRKTQNYMKKKYPDDPYKWAAFVLVR